MTPPVSPDSRVQMGAVAFAVAGMLFAVYGAVAPRADETTLDGAALWASAGWSIAHISAIVGLVLIPLGYAAIRGFLDGTPQERTAHVAAVIGYIGSGLTISSHGTEVHGLKAIGERAVADGDSSPTAMTVFTIGLLLVAVVLAAIAVWRSGSLPRWSAVPLAALLAPPVLPPARGADRLGRIRRHHRSGCGSCPAGSGTRRTDRPDS